MILTILHQLVTAGSVADESLLNVTDILIEVFANHPSDACRVRALNFIFT